MNATRAYTIKIQSKVGSSATANREAIRVGQFVGVRNAVAAARQCAAIDKGHFYVAVPA